MCGWCWWQWNICTPGVTLTQKGHVVNESISTLFSSTIESSFALVAGASYGPARAFTIAFLPSFRGDLVRLQ